MISALWVMLLSTAGIQDPGGAPPSLAIVNLLPPPLDGEAERLLRDELPVLSDAIGSGTAALQQAELGSAVWLVFGADLGRLEAWRAAGALRTGAIPDVPDVKARAPDGSYAVLLSSSYAIAWAPSLMPEGAAPRTWNELATMREWSDRLGLPDPAFDATPWLGAMEQRLAEGEGETAGFALWLALDARVDRYRLSHPEIEAGLDGGDLAVAVLPVAVCVRARAARGLPPLRWQPFAGGSPVARLGVGVRGNGPVPEALTAAVAHLCSPAFRDRAARRLGLEVFAGPLLGGSSEAGRWLRHFEERVRGRGRSLEDLDSWLDIGFGIAFLGFLTFVYFRLRRTESAAASP